MSNLDDLLKSSLSKNESHELIYSNGSHFFVAFFGGPIACVLFSFASVLRIHQFKRHALFLALLFSLAISLSIYIYWRAQHDWPHVLLIGGTINYSVNILFKLLSIVLYGCVYWRFKPYFNISNFSGSAPTPWLLGIAVVLICNFIHTILSIVVAQL